MELGAPVALALAAVSMAMVGEVFFPGWYRVADLRPRLRRHVALARHRYRGRRWFLLRDPISGKHFRLNERGWALVGRCDGHRTLDRLWRELCETLGDAAPTQGEIIELLGRLHQADLIHLPASAWLDEFQRRHKRHRRARWIQYLRSPLSVKMPLWDPDLFLQRTLPLVAPLFSRAGMAVWLLVVGLAAVVGGVHFEDLREPLRDQLFSLEGLAAVAVLYPLVKAIHELAHGWAVKRWGGEVHEMGVMLLVFMPIPYVDASASTSFESRYRRMTVAGAGIMAELLIAAMALFFWVNAEPGLARSMAWHLILIGVVSSLLVNGNPLLKFDGYFVLADWLEMPNLAKRANEQVAYLARRWLLGDRSARSAAQAPGERPWLVGYAALSFVYRTLLVAGILLYVSGQFFAIGIVLAMWALTGSLLIPLLGKFWRLVQTLSIRRKRVRGYALLLGGAGALWALVALVPFPHNLVVEGVAWAPDTARLRLAEPCQVERVLSTTGQMVVKGQPLFECRNDELDNRYQVAQARLEQARARELAAGRDRAERALAGEAVRYASAQVRRMRERMASLTVRAPRTGALHLPMAQDLPGRLLPRGTAVGLVLRDGELTVRGFVDQAGYDLIRASPGRVEARRVSDLDTVLRARVLSIVPGATRRVPSRVLTVAGGGPWVEMPGSGDAQQAELPETLQAGFVVDLTVEPNLLELPEERVYLRFVFSPEPLLPRLERALHALFLRHFDV